ncbi:thioredoxin-like protein [Halteromyces radiatus]|uniref:thioredoxin-like protein n=1 Tax=Halteromyces radiatus TaxID=101107 RepID=UPI00221F33A5|nr:thioredoxin-like protein [Halteromyces radiatus]KAI8092873.1 thioredoxin-like protein [Halteromyces radiatus]
MALSPLYIGHRLGAASAPHTLEVYLDYVCPFSAKIYKSLRTQVLPWLEKEHPNKVQFVFRHQVQPWHASSTLVHEAALVVERLSPDDFLTFSDYLFEHQRDYFDEAVEAKTRRQLVEQISHLIVSTTPGLDQEKIIHALANGTTDPASATNKGNSVSADLKWHIRFARQNAIHVSPTVAWDGLRDDAVSSGWSLSQWQDYFTSKL